MELKKLNLDEITEQVGQTNGWMHMIPKDPQIPEDIDMLYKMFPCANFRSSIDLMNKIAEIAERLNHYPSLMIGPTYANVTLWTQDIGGLTTLDFELARAIDNLK